MKIRKHDAATINTTETLNQTDVPARKCVRGGSLMILRGILAYDTEPRSNLRETGREYWPVQALSTQFQVPELAACLIAIRRRGRGY